MISSLLEEETTMLGEIKDSITTRAEFLEFFDRSRAFLTDLTPVERNSIWIAQGLTSAAFQMLLDVSELGNSYEDTLRRLNALRTKVALNVAIFDTYIEGLTPEDREYVVDRIDKMIAEVEAEVNKIT